MKKALIVLLVSIIKQLVGSTEYEIIEDEVKNQSDSSATGSEKRAAVISATQALAGTVATYLINLAIETAVARLNT